jgi:hypothetical protein
VVPNVGAAEGPQILRTACRPGDATSRTRVPIMSMAVVRPDWWCYPERCSNGHEWGPGLTTVSWVLCDCPPAQAVRERAGGPAGHMAVFCNAAPGCRSVWYMPRHEPGHR